MQSLSAPSPGTSWLPPGHPFTNLMTDDNYWTSTQVDANSVRVMARNGTSTQEIKTGMPPPANHAWCVRGGTGADALP